MSSRLTGIRRTKEDIAVDTFVYIFVIVMIFVCLYPFYLAIVLAFNSGIDTKQGGIYFWPRKFTLDNFEAFVNDPDWIHALFVSIARTVLGTIVTTICTCFVGYGLSKKDLAFRKVYIGIIIFSMYFSGGLIPYFIVLRVLGLLNNFLVYIIPGALSIFFVLISISFFQAIPAELAESARLDGANEYTIFFRIILRVSTPLLACIAIFTAVGAWNAWFDTAFFAMQRKDLRTLAYELMAVVNKTVGRTKLNTSAEAYASATITPISIQLAAMIIAIAPILAVYPFFQRYFISGLTLGSVKG